MFDPIDVPFSVQFHFALNPDTDIVSILEEIADNVFLKFECSNSQEQIYNVCRLVCSEREVQGRFHFSFESPDEATIIVCLGDYRQASLTFTEAVDSYFIQTGELPQQVKI